MAITTDNAGNQVLAGFQPIQPFFKTAGGTMVAGRPWSFWSVNGIPGAGDYDNTLAGVALSSTSALVDGQIPYYDPSGGALSYLARFYGTVTIAGTLILADRLWHNGGFTITQTTAQTVNSATWPARDRNGSTNGEGVYIGLEVSATCGAAAPAPTISYTNSAGTAGRSAGLWFPTANNPAANSFFIFNLQTGDIGVRSVQSYIQNVSWVSGTINLVAFRILAMANLKTPAVNHNDLLNLGFPKVLDSSVLFIIVIPTAAFSGGMGTSVLFSQG